jgi:hypothetical protein
MRTRIEMLPRKADPKPAPGFAERFGGFIVLSLLALATVAAYAASDGRGFDRLLSHIGRVFGL